MSLCSSFSSVLRAEQFTSLIGADETPITVHSGAIAGLSEPLNCVVNGAFQEACNNVARFPEITMDDFERIFAILYQSSLPASESVFLDPATFNIAEDFWILSPKIQSGRSTQIHNNRLTAHYLYTCFGDPNTHFGTKAATLGKDRWNNTVDDHSAVNLLDPNDYPKKPLQNVEASIKQLQRQESERPPAHGWNQDVSGILMSYARRYVFADKYLIDSLKRDMERELRVALLQLDVYRPTRPGIFQLVEYVYNGENIPNRRDGVEMHPIREIVVKFMVLHLSAFQDYLPHRELLWQTGDYAVEFQDVVQKWLL